MKVPEADRRTSGQAAEARAVRRSVYGFAEDLGSEDSLVLAGVRSGRPLVIVEPSLVF
jgi:hypothetical protein